MTTTHLLSGPAAGGGLSRPVRRTSPAPRSHLRHLSRSIRLEEDAAPGLARGTIWSLTLALTLLVGWAGVTTVPEIVRAPGQIAPSGFERDLNHPDGGTLSEVLVRPGAQVEQGQPVAVFDTALLEDDLTRLDERTRSLGIRAERLRAFLDERPADFSPFGDAGRLDVSEADATLAAMRLDFDNRQAVVRRQREQRDQDLTALIAERGAAKQSLADFEELMTRQEKLEARGLVRFSDFIDLRRDVTTARGAIAVLDERIAQARVALGEFDARLSSIGSAERSQVFQQLSGIEANLADTAASADKLRGQLARSWIVAPVAGHIKLREGLAPGSFVAPGASLGQIVPKDAPLVAQVRIDPRDVSRVEVGSPVQVKVSAYDFVRFGAIPGTLSQLSPGAFTSSEGTAYFTAEIAFDREYLGSVPGTNPVSTGMTVQANVVNGERTLLGYLFKPVKLALDGAFHES